MGLWISRLKRSLPWTILFVGTIAVSFVAHRRAGMTLPVPWPDESAFLWQSIAIMTRGTLFAPELNPNVHVMWMPPGYMVVMGGLFKLLGFSLAKARWISWFFSVCSYVGIVGIFRRSRYVGVIAVLMSLFFLGSFFVVLGNVARMEAMVLAIVIWSTILLQRRQVWFALAALVAACLIHPNAVYFLVMACIWVVLEFRRCWPPPRRIDIVACALALVLVVAYAAYVAMHRAPFLEHMRFQMARKQTLLHAMPWFLFSVKKLAFVAVYVAAIVVSLAAVRRALLPLLLGLTCFATFITTREMWYDVYFVVSMMLLAGGVILVLERFTGNFPGARRHIPVAAVALFFLVFARREGFVEAPRGYPARMAWHQMSISNGVPYMTSKDIESVTTALDSVAQDAGLRTIQFYPFADALFFWPELSERWTVVQPVFAEREADVIVLHTSRFLPASWDHRPGALRERFGTRGWCAARDETERWCVRTARAQ